MFVTRLRYTVSAIAILGLLATSSAGAVFNSRRTTRVTFSGAIQLPGVSLPAGTYTFEVPAPDFCWEIVRVSSRDGRRVYFTGFTRPLARPTGLSGDKNIIFGESPAGGPTPIKAWFPQDERTGRQFIY
jgi:hypothetical protein